MLVKAIEVIIVFSLAAGFSIFSAALFSFGVIPLVYTLRKVPKEKRRIGYVWRSLLTVLLGGVMTFSLVRAYVRWDIVESRTAELDYWGYPGQFDYYRMPLEYPYELAMIDLGNWHRDKADKEKSMIAPIKRDGTRRV